MVRSLAKYVADAAGFSANVRRRLKHLRIH